jgi:CubicO group peptidase (beta-lactamase class C family)
MSYKISVPCMKVISLLIFLLLLQPVFPQNKWAELEQALLQKQTLLGKNIVVMVSNKDSLLYKKETGDFNSKTPAPIASCSKWLTAALVMIFVDEGKLSLDDKVVKYLPEFGKYFKNHITIRHCLSHMTGISDEGGLIKKLFKRRIYKSLEEEVNEFAAREIRANAGTDFWYGNVGLNIVARVLEVISKKKFDLLIKQKLFNPLGMRNTTFSTLDYSAINPSGGAKSTADDYMNFLLMLLNKGTFKGKQILREESVMEMMRLQTTEGIAIKYAPKSAQGFGYALGSWVLEENPKLEIYLDSQPLNRPLVPVPATGEIERKTVMIPTSLASPGLFGTWPMIDYCRGYAYIVFVKNLLGEERAEVHMELKKIIDKEMESTCK